MTTEPLDIHTYFSLSYASYLVVNRSLLQSMPLDWQYRFTALMAELTEEFADIEEPTYKVIAQGDGGRFIRDPIANYNRGRTFIKGKTNDPRWCEPLFGEPHGPDESKERMT